MNPRGLNRFAWIVTFAALLNAGEPAPTAPTVASAKIEWTPELLQGLANARQQNKPLLVLLEIPEQAATRQLEAAFENADVAALATRFVAVRMNVRQDTRLLDELVVRVLPDLRVFNVDSKQVAHATGLLSVEELIKFLTGAETAVPEKGAPTLAALFPSTDLDGLLKLETAGRIPEGAALLKLLQLASGRSGETRAEAQRLLRKWAAPLSPALVEQLSATNVKLRLTAWEVLLDQQAPLEKYDPFAGPIDNGAREKLAAWAKALAAAPAAVVAANDLPTLPAHLRAQADVDLQQYLSGDAVRAEAAQQRLLGIGKGLVPILRNRTRDLIAQQPEQAVKLDRLRFRLLLSADVLRRAPGAAERLAEGNTGARATALGRVLASGAMGLADLLNEAACDRDPLFRETAIRNALRVSDNPDPLLREALKDRETNVRVAALAAMAKTARKENNEALTAYLKNETDEELLCHAIAALVAVKNKTSQELLQNLLTDERWRVRAAAAEALGKMGDKTIGALLTPLLKGEDGFVAAKAVEALSKMEDPTIVPQLAEVVDKHPGTTMAVLAALSGYQLRKAKETDKVLRKLARAPAADVRAKAILALASDQQRPAYDEVSAGLKDAEKSVRAAAAEGLRLLINKSTLQAQLDRSEQPQGYLDVRATLLAMAADPDENLRLHVNVTMAYFGDWKTALPELSKLILHPTEDVRLEVYEAFGMLPAEVLRDLIGIRIGAKALPLDSSEAYRLPYTFRETLRGTASTWVESDPVVEALFALLPHLPRRGWEYWYTTLRSRGIGDDPRNVRAADRKALTSLLLKRMDTLPPDVRNVVRLLWMSVAELGEDELKKLLDDTNVEIRRQAALLLIDQADKGPDYVVKKLIADSTAELRHLGVAAAIPASWRGQLNDPTQREWVGGAKVYRSRSFGFSSNSNQKVPKVVELPVETLQGLLRDEDEGVRAVTAYLMAMEGGDHGIRELHQQWKAEPNDSTARRMLLKAVSMTFDDSMTSMLEDVYNYLNQSGNSDTYYIREVSDILKGLPGQQVKKLRARIKREHPNLGDW